MNTIDIKRGEQQTLIRHINSQGQAEDLTINIGAGAQLRYIEVANTKDFASVNVTFNCERDSSLTVNTLDVNNKSFERSQTYNLNSENVEVQVIGLYLTGVGETVSNKLKINHFHPNCSSKQLYRGVVEHRALFNGHIYIAPNAQQTVALQENNNIILNDNAKVETQPWLEIYADDVKCNHGATVGKNDDQALYYMRQRGIPTHEAKKLLLEGFIAQCVIDSDQKENIMELITNKIKSL